MFFSACSKRLLFHLQPMASMSRCHVPTIQLSGKEQQIVALLKATNDHYHLGLTLRFAGGWVRDKLLGLESDDIDVTVDHLTGEHFAHHLNGYLKHTGQANASIGVISLRPDQSKHLETATMTLLDYKVDFVNLRSEAYSEDSRIPSHIKFGTPSEDAHRRDITINSLFYNIHTEHIEDYTGKGLNDLKDKMIRTPLPATEIFLDDPLRVLRAIRFASRFNYIIHPDIYDAVQNVAIRKALKEKISRERVGMEMKKMLYDGALAFLSISYVHSFGLAAIVYDPPPRELFVQAIDFEACEKSASWQSHLFCKLLQVFLPEIETRWSWSVVSTSQEPSADPGDAMDNQMTQSPLSFPLPSAVRYLLWNSMNLLPFRGLKCYKKETDKRKPIFVSEYIARESLKMSNLQVEQILGTVESVNLLLEYFEKHTEPPFPRGSLVSCLRLVGPRWESAWIMAHCLLYYATHEADFEFFQHLSCAEQNAVQLKLNRNSFDKILCLLSAFRKQVYNDRLYLIWTTRPALNGTEVIQLLNIKKPTAYLQRILSELVIWQLSLPAEQWVSKALATEALLDIHDKQQEKLNSIDYPPKEF